MVGPFSTLPVETANRRRQDTPDTSSAIGAVAPRGHVAQSSSTEDRDTLKITRFHVEGQPPLRRNIVPRSPQQQRPPPGLLIRRTAAPETNGPPGPVLRRTTLPRRSSQRSAASPKGRPRRSDRPQQNNRPRRRALMNDDLEGAEGQSSLTEDEIENIIDPPQNPTVSLPYAPKDLDLNELRADWPDTIASPIGAVEILEQKLQQLARRIPHGYQAPEMIAEHYQRGNLTRFESVEEREKVLEHARKLAKDRGDALTDRKGEAVSPADMAFADLAGAAEKAELTQTIVRGMYPELEKEQRPFLDSVAQILRNNSTYHGPEQTRLMDKVRSLLPQGGAASGQQQREKAG